MLQSCGWAWARARLAGRALSVDCKDKFPKVVDYVVPTGIRPARNASRVRLGFYVGEGNFLRGHEGFISLAGTTGVNWMKVVSLQVLL